MKKSLLKATALTALVTVLLTAEAAAANVGSGIIAVDSLRMRSEPSTESSTITYLIEGTEVKVHEVLDGWYKASYLNYTGYLSAEFVNYSPYSSFTDTTPSESTDTAGADAPDQDDTLLPPDTLGEESSLTVMNADRWVTIAGTAVNIRSGPSTSDTILGRVNDGDQLALEAIEDGWCQVIYNGQTAYVSGRYACADGLPVMASGQGVITANCVNVRSGPSMDSGIITRVYTGDQVELVSLEDGWYYVLCNNDINGYISSDYIRPYSGSESSAIGDQAAELAMGYLGCPYVYGGSSPKGFDCSGFTMYVYSQLGYSLPHSATSQWNSSGTYVEKSDLQPGDLVLFCDPAHSNGKACSHVGIYVGDDEFVHAASGSSSRRVRISSLSENYYSSYYKGAKRIG